MGEDSIVRDGDVLQADGGTRTADITGAYVALADAIRFARDNKLIAKNAQPLIDTIAAVSVGIIDGVPMLDLPYVEDVRAETDMNVVVTGSGKFVEVQGTAEGAPFDRDELNQLLDLAPMGPTALPAVQPAPPPEPLCPRTPCPRRPGAPRLGVCATQWAGPASGASRAPEGAPDPAR